MDELLSESHGGMPLVDTGIAAPERLGRSRGFNRDEILSGEHDAEREVSRREAIFRRLLGLADAFGITATLAIVAPLTGSDRLTWAALAVPPLFVLVAKILGLYDRDAHLLHKITLDEAPKVFALSTATALLLWLSGDFFVSGGLGRGQVLGAWAMLFVLVIALRAIARVLARALTPVERCLFVGDPQSATELREKLAASRAVKAELVGWLPAPATADDHAEQTVNLPQMIKEVVAEREVHRVILGSDSGVSGELLDAIRRIKDYGLKVSVLPDVSRVVSSSVELDRLNGITLLGVRRFEITRSSRIVKRAFDVTGSSVALLLCSPILLVIAVAIKLDSPGPVFFRQRRAGRHGEAFWIMKFRSMEDGADAQKEELLALNESDGLFKITNDPRVTRLGRLLRRRHLDELPQLVNVLRGEMSLVGPRPLVLEEDRRIVGWHRHRLDLRPGITGPWQVLRSHHIPVREMVTMDYQYVADWSLWNDVRILLLTVALPFQNRGI